MELNLKEYSYEGQWFDFGNGRLKIRPYPASKMDFAFNDGNIIISGEQSWEKFKYCLMAWENYVTPAPEHKPIELSDEVKKKVFDFHLVSVMIDDKEVTMSAFVVSKADELFTKAVIVEKNLSTSQSGDTA